MTIYEPRPINPEENTVTQSEALSRLRDALPADPTLDGPIGVDSRDLREALAPLWVASPERLNRLMELANATPSRPVQVLYQGATDRLPGTDNQAVSLVAIETPPGTDVVIIKASGDAG